MAMFTTAIQNDIIKLAIGMFKASVGGKYLQDFRQFVESVPAGRDPVVELAKTLQTKVEFSNVFPSSQTNAQFQDAFLSYLSLQNNQEAKNFITQKLAAGVGRGEVILEAVRALDTYTGQDATIKAAQNFLTGKFNLAFAHSVNNNVQESALSPLQAVLLDPMPMPSVAPSAAPPAAPPAAPAPAPVPPKTVVEGVLSAGPVLAGNQLEVSAFGGQGQLLGTAPVDAGGKYSLAIPLTYTGPILVRVFDKGTSPDYLDEATGQPKDLNTDLRAVGNIPFAGGTFQVNVNPLTELAVKAVGLQSGDNGNSQVNLNNITPQQITQANTQVAIAFGLNGISLTSSDPNLIVNADGTTNPNANTLGRVLASISGVEAGQGQTTGQVLDQFLTSLNQNNGTLGNEARQTLIVGSINVDPTGSRGVSRDVGNSQGVSTETQNIAQATYAKLGQLANKVNPAPTVTLQEVQSLGVTGLTAGKLAGFLDLVSKSANAAAVDSFMEIQALVNQANADTTPPVAPTAVTLTPQGGTVVANTTNTTNTNLNIAATITAGDATGGKAEFFLGATKLGEDTTIAAGDTSVTFTTSDGTPTNAELQTAIAAGGVVTVKLFDAAGNNTTSAVANPTLAVDYAKPTVTITHNKANTVTTADANNGAITYTFTFNEVVTGFDATDVTVTNGSKGTFTPTTEGENAGKVYTLTVTPTAGLNGNVTVAVTADKANDAAGNGNAAATDNVQAVNLNTSNVTPDGRSVVTPSNTTDPLFSTQWYLNNTGQRYTVANPKPDGITLLDLNIMPVWARGITGKGTVVAITDDGIDLNHEDLTNQLIKDKTYNPDSTSPDGNGGVITTGVGSYPAPAANTKDHQHGTVVGSIVGMEALNGKGMVGVALGTKLVSTISAGENHKTFEYLKGLNNLGNISGGVDVSVNSYGLDPSFSDKYYIAPNTPVENYTAKQKEGEAIRLAATEGRGGKGIVIEVSAGNEATNRADPAMTNFTSSRFIIASGAVTEQGFRTEYSTPGASVLVSAFGGVGAANQDVNSGFGIPSADISGTLGYNTTANADNSYAYQSQGTSYSGPMVGATAALMLQANPNLGFRDVSTILAMTARKVGAEAIFQGQTANAYINNKATDWNLGGMHFSRDIGYGLIDVTAAVQLAESWTLTPGTAANWVSAVGVSQDATNANIPDNDATTGLTVTANLANNVRIERMEFELDLGAAKPNQLKAVVTSPNGTEIVLFDRPLSSQLIQAQGQPEGVKVAGPDITPWPGVFSIGSTAFLGESSAGNWTLKLFDLVTGDQATYKSLTVRAWGSTITEDSQYVMTREFTGDNKILTDTAGTDLINASALQTAVTINLNEGQMSTILTGQTFSIANGSVIENATGGSAADTLTGNAAANLLRGNLGADTLMGGAGNDTFFYYLAQDSTLTAGDTILDFSVDGDKLDVLNLDANTNIAENQNFSFLGTNALTANGLRYEQTGGNTLVQADLDGNASTVEFQVTLVGTLALNASHFNGVAV